MNSHSSKQSRRVSVGKWIVVGVAAVLIFVVLWVMLRAIMARDELLEAIPVARSIGSAVLASEPGGVTEGVAELQARADNAASLTSDPIWRAAEYVPFLGENLTAFRLTASMIDDIATDALPPLAEAAHTFNLEGLSDDAGVIDLAMLESASPLLNKAHAALEEGDARAAGIETENTIPQIGAAVDQVQQLVADATQTIAGFDKAASLLPSMLGGDEERTYLLLSLNNSELRATGGIPGAIAEVKANQGKITLGDLSSADELGEFGNSVLPLTDSEKTLYQDIMSTYMQNVNFTPDFARSGELAQAMWQERTGNFVDGVIAVDPIALSYILGVTGPVETSAGFTLTSDNAVDVLLSGVYSMFEEPARQDIFFAEVTGTVFSAVTGGGVDNLALLTALAKSADEDRIHIWSSREEEQLELEGTRLAGQVPVSSDESTAFGVYFNDATGAKMDYYLSSAIGIASGNCRVDERPNFEVQVKLESRAPTDAGESLPAYVTAGGDFGVTPGNIRTNVYVYAPAGSVPYSVSIDGQEYAFVSANHDQHSVAGVTVELSPGQISTVSMKFVGDADAAESVTLQHTPMSSAVVTSLDNYLDCSAVQPAPVEGDEEQSGALSGAESYPSASRG
jgi:hypothetical protein